MSLLRRPALPDDVRAALELARGERVLATGRLADGWAVATTHGIAVVHPGGADAAEGAAGLRRPWTDVSTGRLDPDTETLTVEWVDGATATVLHLADARSLAFPAAFRQCVDSSVVHAEQVTLADRTVVRVALRRDGDGQLFTQVMGPGTVDLTDPSTAAAVDAAEARVREAAGL
ncbi:hypothetical protein [Actinotalea fermentans]|uniref:Uncharacterized protein n=1 Tax=Actinotalea fermentans TaxID=43671 RepID=A0A511YTT0_9CELL|nr:hypothetical protein [Actinotalea fermentans]KGM17736.1 hypothetical protein N867_13605 [Actinotalea fermentans ATCC 43279 = JCM 9966 = DSM 3133]GEN78595.1 hypothetical protein AFE02nite_03290 [Actinotalea fermentans]